MPNTVLYMKVQRHNGLNVHTYDSFKSGYMFGKSSILNISFLERRFRERQAHDTSVAEQAPPLYTRPERHFRVNTGRACVWV